jgi:hypothetical protein
MEKTSFLLVGGVAFVPVGTREAEIWNAADL